MISVEEIEAFCPKVEEVAPKRGRLAEQCGREDSLLPSTLVVSIYLRIGIFAGALSRF
jgi:hypothetical protein